MVADPLVTWILGGAAGVADAGADDTGETPKLGIWTPESTEGEGRRLELSGGRRVKRRWT